MAKSTVVKLPNEEVVLREQWMLEQAKQAGLGKQKRDWQDLEIEETLNLWFSAVIMKGITMSGLILRKKAKELTQKLGRPDFIATDDCLSCWAGKQGTR